MGWGCGKKIGTGSCVCVCVCVCVLTRQCTVCVSTSVWKMLRITCFTACTVDIHILFVYRYIYTYEKTKVL